MTPPVRSRPDRRAGFVLALVVLMLFAVSVAGAAGYLIVNTEFGMARYSGQGAEASIVARAGLHRFAAEQLGVVGDSVAYAIGNGIALVTSRKILEEDSLNHLYYLRSEGTVADPRRPESPARSVTGSYAYHRKRPLRHLAAMVVAAEGGWAQTGSADVDGNDHSGVGECPGAGAPAIPGIIAQYSTGALNNADLDGDPPGLALSGGFAEIYDSVALRWDILSDPSFPVDFDGSPPDFGLLPPDSFPVVRVSGYFNPGNSWSGRGVLIVDGELDARASFVWEGIVLAGAVDDIHEGHIRGMLVAGLDGPNPYDEVYWRGTVLYDSCNVYAANESLSYLELIENAEFEAF